MPRLPPDTIVARYVGGLHLDPGTGQINGSAFERTAKDIDGVSFTRRGILAIGTQQDRAAIRQVMASRLRLGATAVFAELQAGTALDALSEFEQAVSFVEDALAADGDRLANPAHALLLGFPFRGEQVGSLKSEVAGDRLRSCIIDRFPAAPT
ncbi:hypothetical protein [Sphingomonas bacterium]|uniref:hypothetical protein n=1 Tax=Sphingomonas bacterium TaxID=1895847 RepID=UPI0015776BDC|nr:hypothetical protein [Sphingomonas bacterium]